MLIALIVKLISWIPRGTESHIFTPILLAIDNVLPENTYTFVVGPGQIEEDEVEEFMAEMAVDNPDYRILN